MVDLDALEAELSANIGKDKTFDAMPIIRRAVSPSAPEGLRDRIAEAAFDAHSKSIDVSVPQAKWPPHRDWVVRYETEADYILDVISLAGLTVADAVLAVLPPAPRVDVDAVCSTCHGKNDRQIEARYPNGDGRGYFIDCPDCSIADPQEGVVVPRDLAERTQ